MGMAEDEERGKMKSKEMLNNARGETIGGLGFRLEDLEQSVSEFIVMASTLGAL